MAKSKKKSSKSKKTKQQKKSIVATKKAPKIETAKDLPTRIDNSAPILAGVFVCFALALSVGIFLATTAKDSVIKSSAEPSPNSSQQSIEVVEPDSSNTTPGSTDYDIQGSSPAGQQNAEGGLQTPSVDPLQPNARIEDYENAVIN